METFSHYPSWPPPVRVPLATFPEHDCPYLPPRLARSRGFLTGQIDAETYHDFMDAGFRRSGTLIYQPACRGCRECRPIRVVVNRFKPDKSQRRCMRRNADLSLTVASRPSPTDEKFLLYQRYMRLWHGCLRESSAEFEAFLCESPTDTIELSYRDRSGMLVAVGICDVCTRSLSSVYFYFDPSQPRRGLGTFGALIEIQIARSRGIPHYYLGYWVEGCKGMSYKNSFRPNEILGADGIWRNASA